MFSKENKKTNIKFRPELILILPSIIGILIFYIFPFFDVIRRSFSTDFERQYTGLDNYKTALTNKAFSIAAANTIKFIMICLPVLLLFSFILALLLTYEKIHIKRYKKIFLLPMAIPIASLVLVWKLFFHTNGLVNQLLSIFNVEAIDFFHSKYAFLALGFTYIWRNFGYSMLLWLTGMENIDQDMYEAAAIDGAGYLKKTWYITLPQLKDMGFVIIMISILNSFKVFREAYLIAGDYPHQSIYLLQHLFNNWFVNLELGKLTAGAVMVAAVVMVFIVLTKKVLLPEEKNLKGKAPRHSWQKGR